MKAMEARIVELLKKNDWEYFTKHLFKKNLLNLVYF